MIPFLKMHGCGNDFIVIDDTADRFGWHELSALATRLCRRRFAIGADGLIAVGHPPGGEADFEMRYLNADGSRAEMCGNGIRCTAKFAADVLGFVGIRVRMLTGAGVLPLEIHREAGEVTAVTVEMGVPGLLAGEVPTTLKPANEPAVNVLLSIENTTLPLTCVSLGNPHAVCFVEQITDEHVNVLGPRLEAHAVFPHKTNAEFVRVLGPDRLRMRVWERGVGETMACGTGACASVVAAVLTGQIALNTRTTVHLNGGDLFITWPAADQPVLMTGPAVTAYRGEFEV
ncbi:diaminopimelate epimerase [bacterium]|nr:diaminopimelate epimerase [bacterium]